MWKTYPLYNSGKKKKVLFNILYVYIGIGRTANNIALQCTFEKELELVLI